MLKSPQVLHIYPPFKEKRCCRALGRGGERSAEQTGSGETEPGSSGYEGSDETNKGSAAYLRITDEACGRERTGLGGKTKAWDSGENVRWYSGGGGASCGPQASSCAARGAVAGGLGKVVFERRGEFLRLRRWRCEHEQGASGRAAMAKGNSGGALAFPFIAARTRERVGAARRPGRAMECAAGAAIER